MDIEYKKDTASIDDIYLHLLNCSRYFEPPLDQKVDILEYSKKIAKSATTFEAWADNNLIGLVAAYLNSGKGGIGYITNVSVVKEYSGKNIGSKLISDCILYACEKGFLELGLEVDSNNQKAIKLYEKLEFIRVGSDLGNIFMKRAVPQNI